MALRILDLDNPTPEDSDYIYGNIKDDTGAGDGTPMNVKSFGDMYQFFQRLMDKAGVTPNGLPDNNYSGFQLFQALSGDWNIIGAGGQPPFQNAWGNDNPSTENSASYKREVGWLCLRGVITGGSNHTIAFTLPALFRPKKLNYTIAPIIGDTANLGQVTINSAGQVDIRYSGGGTVSLDGIRIPLD